MVGDLQAAQSRVAWHAVALPVAMNVAVIMLTSSPAVHWDDR